MRSAVLKCLTCFLFCFSINLVEKTEGKLEFFEETPKEGKDALEGSKVSFVCRNTGNTPPYTVTWSVKNSTGQFILAHKGILTSYVDKERYKLTQENTALEITQLKLSDTGMYSCDLITLASGQHFFSAKVLLNVTGKASSALHPSPSVIAASSAGSVSSLPVTSPMTRITSPPIISKIATTVKPVTRPPHCGNNTNQTGGIAFRKTSPKVTTVNEGSEFKLLCSYCLMKQTNVIQKWYNSEGEIMNSEVHVISEDSLIIPKAHHDVHEGWYECLVETPHHNISALFTVIVDKVEINPILTYVKAKTMNSTTALIQWTLKRFGSYIITRIKLHLRKLASKEWTHGVDEITRETGSHLFQDLKPDTMYVLHIEVINNDEMKETKTMVFTTAFSHKAKVIYRATSGEAIAVALSIVAFVICMAGICVCYSWCYDDKRHYITPTHRHLYNRYRDRRGERREKDSLCNNTNAFYNRAFDEGPEDEWKTDVALG